MNYPHATTTLHASDPQHERALLRFRQHASRLTGAVLCLLVAALITGGWLGSFTDPLLNILAAVGVCALAIGGFLAPYTSWLARRTTITTQRVIIREGVFVRRRHELQVAQVRTISTSRNILQRMLGSGNITVSLHGSASNVVLANVPGVRDVTEILQQLAASSYAAQTRSQHSFFAAQQYDTSAVGSPYPAQSMPY
ncbi:PH domain-containing protein [Canibacter sp. lx-45]|uniref:PH domain-containing protein n=1 Tax=Canibacter zhuwentaonis TaxID=2837491 RepID=UPI001BDD8CC7|nr:PH domain-containing protein [Canibacter zhuwentaonis]MBT1035433.1 PH domain-containing protein [Canibacter zhuwentaonis]